MTSKIPFIARHPGRWVRWWQSLLLVKRPKAWIIGRTLFELIMFFSSSHLWRRYCGLSTSTISTFQFWYFSVKFKTSRNGRWTGYQLYIAFSIILASPGQWDAFSDQRAEAISCWLSILFITLINSYERATMKLITLIHLRHIRANKFYLRLLWSWFQLLIPSFPILRHNPPNWPSQRPSHDIDSSNTDKKWLRKCLPTIQAARIPGHVNSKNPLTPLLLLSMIKIHTFSEQLLVYGPRRSREKSLLADES